MDIVHIKVTFKDTFSGAMTTKTVTRSKDTFDKMKNGIGSIVTVFENNIKWNWEVVKVEQA